MADRLAEGNLERRISQLRAEGLTPERISKTLFAEYGIEVTRQTLSTWFARLDEVAA